MRHVTSKFYTVDSGTPNPTRFQKTLAVNDFYFGVPGDPEWDGVPLGHVHLMGKHAGWQILQDLGVGAMSPEEADVLAAHSVDWWVQSEDLPLPDNRVTVGSEGELRVRYTETNRLAQEHLMDRLEAALREMGFDRFLRVPMPLEVMNHQCGTCRMGTDPAASVVDASGRAHEVSNLYLADASVFPSSAATNPTLTIAANALRVAGHLSDQVL
jgi:choline dehydrogenase-like flavoprotein